MQPQHSRSRRRRRQKAARGRMVQSKQRYRQGKRKPQRRQRSAHAHGLPDLYYNQRLEAVEVATAIAQMTHWDENSNRACEIYTDMIYLITEAVIKQGEKRRQRDRIIDGTLHGTPYELDRLAKRTEDLNPTGYVVDSMKCAVTAAFWNAESFEEAIIAAANMGGDADTIAAITGGLAGAYYGYDAIPERWIKELAPEVKERLDRLTEAAFTNRTMEQRRD